MATVRTFFFIC